MNDVANAVGRSFNAKLVHGGAFAGVIELLGIVRLVAAVVMLGFLVSERFVGVTVSAFVVTLVLSALIAAGQALGRRARKEMTPGQVRAVGRELRFEADSGARVRTIDLDRLRSATVIPTSERGRSGQLVMRGRGGQRIALAFSEREEARSLLAEMKMSPREASATFYFFFGLYVTVGADGVLLRWPLLARQRFVPYAKILSINPHFGVIELALTNGDAYQIMTTTSTRSKEQQQHQALLERVAHACASYRAEHAEEPTALLHRSGRSARGWIKDLSLLGQTGGGGYRVASVPIDTLWNVALDPAAKEETRIGAALALRGALDGEGRQKLRVAAEASASPNMRSALDAAARELTDDELGEVLETSARARRTRA